MAGPAEKVRQCSNNFRSISGGPFQFGSPSGIGDPNEHPARNVTLDPFQIQEHEVSIGEIKRSNEIAGKLRAVLWGCKKGALPDTITTMAYPGETQRALKRRAEQIAGDFGCNPDNIHIGRQPKIEIWTRDWCGEANRKGDDYPVACLKHDMAMLYCKSIGATLPTAAQIEFISDTGGETPSAVTYENSGNSTAPVCGPAAEKRNNRLGVRDIEGNLWEMTQDQYDPDYYSRVLEGEKNPRNPFTNPAKQAIEVRGGSCFNDGRGRERATKRDYGFPLHLDVGFRCVRLRGLP